jgi:DNA-binding SARP family transcriptional activator
MVVTSSIGRVAVRLLGPVEVTGPKGDAVFGGGRQRALVGALALKAGTIVVSSRLVDALWGVEPPRTAFKTLHGHVARLRRVLQACGLPDLLVTAGSGYMFAARRGEIDSLRFEDLVAEARVDLEGNRVSSAVQRLRDGLAQWCGDPVQDGELFSWAGAELNRLKELRLTALEDLFDAELRLGRHEAVVDELERALVHNPLRERLVELLMLAQYRCGRPVDALEAYQKLRVHLADELGVDPAAHLQRLHTAILRQDTTLARREYAQPSASRPAQLPPRVGHFVGRIEQLQALDLTLEGLSDTRIVVVSGTGGMGKTALIVQWAHAVRERFPDGQVFLDMRGHDDRTAMTATAALIHTLRALGVPEGRVPSERPDQVSLLRSMLDTRRVLIVLDNAASIDQILPLVPPSPTSMLAVTSRHAMSALTTYHSVRRIPVDAMSRGDSLTLLRDVVGAERIDREPAQAAMIVTSCAGMPLALRIAAARVVHHSDRTLRELAADLSTVDSLDVLRLEDDSRNVRTVFASAYRTLSAPAATLFRRLGVHPELAFGPHLMAAVSGLAAERTEHALVELVGAHLIADIGDGRYRYHHLIGLYATECARLNDGAAVRAETVTRLLDWYLGIADVANRGLPSTHNRVTPALSYPPADLPFAADHHSALAFLDGERPNLLPVVRFAVAESRDVAAWQLVYLLNGFYTTRGRWEDRIEICQLGLEAAQRLGDAMAEGVMGGALGMAYIRMLRFTEALKYLYPAMERAQAAGDEVGVPRLRNTIGTAYARLRRYDEAVEIYQQVLAAQQSNGDQIGVTLALTNIGLGRVRQGQPELGLANLLEALRLTRDEGDRRTEASVLGCVGEAYLALGRHDAAIDSFRQALKLQEDIDDRRHQVDSLVSIGTTLVLEGELSESLDHLQQALRLSHDLGDAHLISLCLKALAEAHLLRDELVAAGECLQRALALRTSVPDAFEEAAIYRALVELAERSGQDAVANEHRQRAVWLYHKANAATEAAELEDTPAN